MAKFLELENPSGTAILVNVDLVTVVRQVDSNTGHCRLYFDDEDHVTVKGPLAVLKERLLTRD